MIQFVLWPVIARDNLVSSFFGNTIYLVAMSYYVIITFLGYNGMSYQNNPPPYPMYDPLDRLLIDCREANDRVTYVII